MSRGIVRISVVKFGKSPMICQICQGFPPPKIFAILFYNTYLKTNASVRLHTTIIYSIMIVSYDTVLNGTKHKHTFKFIPNSL